MRRTPASFAAPFALLAAAALAAPQVFRPDAECDLAAVHRGLQCGFAQRQAAAVAEQQHPAAVRGELRRGLRSLVLGGGAVLGRGGLAAEDREDVGAHHG